MSTGGTGTDDSKWLKDHLPNCNLKGDLSMNDYIKCFKDLEKISCKDIKDVISKVKDTNDEQQFVKVAKMFNNNKNVLEEGAHALAYTLNNTKCILKEVNNQLLNEKNDPHFDLNEVDEIRDIIISNIGGITQKQHQYMIIVSTIIISILFIVIFIILIMNMKK